MHRVVPRIVGEFFFNDQVSSCLKVVTVPQQKSTNSY